MADGSASDAGSAPTDSGATEQSTATQDSAQDSALEGQSSGPARGPDGKFVKGAPKGSGPGDTPGDDTSSIDLPGVINHRGSSNIFDFEGDIAPEVAAPDALTEGDVEPPAEAKVEPFTFGGEEWESREKAEQSFRTLRGTFKAAQQKTKEAVERAQLNYDRAVQWQREVSNYQQRIATLEASLASGGKVPADTGGGRASVTTEDKPFDPVADIDWKLFDEIRETKGDTVAIAWLEDVRTKGLRAEYDRKFDGLMKQVAQSLEPITRTAEQTEEVKAASDTILRLQTYTTADGVPYYPELENSPDLPKTLNEIGSLAEKWGYPKEFILTDRGLHAAILLYRDYKSQGGNGSGNGNGKLRMVPKPIQPQSPRTPSREEVEARSAAAAVGMPTPSRNQEVRSEIEDIRLAMSTPSIDPVLGFARRNRNSI